MKQKNYLTLDSEFIKYCELNKIDNIDKFAKEVFKKGFDIVKYGETPKVVRNERIIPVVPLEQLEPLIEVNIVPKSKKDIYDE
jgi:hypothetical protein